MRRAVFATILSVGVGGCGNPPPEPQPQAPPEAPAAVEPVDAPAPPPPPPELPEDDPPAGTRAKAEVGMGAKGHGYGAGPVATPLAARWRVEENLVLMNVAHAIDIFKATEGRPPKDHDEFMKRIIRENNIRLPELPPGQRYVYDPRQESLMVESQ